MVVRWPISFNGMMIDPPGGIHPLAATAATKLSCRWWWLFHHPSTWWCFGNGLCDWVYTEETTLDDDWDRSFYYWICPNPSVKWPGSILLAVLTSIDRGFPSGPQIIPWCFPYISHIPNPNKSLTPWNPIPHPPSLSGWCPPVICWLINYSYIYHKP